MAHIQTNKTNSSTQLACVCLSHLTAMNGTKGGVIYRIITFVLKFSNHFSENPLEAFLSNLRNQDGCQEVLEQIRSLFDPKHSPDKWEQMKNFVSKQKDDKSRFSTREEDPQWFQGK